MADYYISSTKYTIQTRNTKRNGTVYDVVFRIVEKDGTEKQKKLSGYANKTKAKQAYTSFVTEHCELLKNNPLKKKKADKQKLIVGELYLQYISAMKGQVKESTLYDREKLFMRYVMPQYKNTDVKDLTTQELYRWQDRLWGTRKPDGTEFAYRYLCEVRGGFSVFLTWVQERYGITNNFRDVKKPRRNAPQREMQVWKKEEFEQFISVVDDPIYRLLFTTLFYTGRRRGEVLALQPKDISHIKDGYISFNKSVTRKSLTSGTSWALSTTKTGKVANVPVCDRVKEAFMNTETGAPFIFGGESPIPANTLGKRFQRYIELSGVPKIRLHDLRHSYVSMLIHLGANVTVVADLISDTTEVVMKTYAHLYNEDKIAIVKRLG